MSQYTTEVRFICESYAGMSESQGYLGIDDILTKAAPLIFSFDFPIFDEKYRLILEKKILKHYYTREIGLETAGLWKLKLDTRMNEIMPYYNKLYESELFDFNPLHDIDVTTTRKIDSEGNTLGTTKVVGSSSKDITNSQTDENSSETTTTIDEATETSNNRHDAGRVTGDKTLTLNTEDTKDYTNTKNLTETTKSNENSSDNGTVTTTANGTNTHSNNIKDENTHTDRYSDTPQGGLVGVLTNEYLTNARSIDENKKRTDTGNETIDTTTTVDTKMNHTTEGNTNTTNTEHSTDAGTLARTGTEQTIAADTHDNTIEDTGTSSTTGNERLTGLDKGKSNQNTNETGSNTRDTTENRNINNVTEYIESVKGKKGGQSYTQLLQDFRQSLLNIDMMIINELSDLFFGLWE